MTTTTAPLIIPAQCQEAASAAETMHAQAIAHRVVDQDTADAAAQSLRIVKDRAKRLEETRLAMTRPLDELKKRWVDFFRGPLELLSGAESHLKREVLSWHQREAEAAWQRAEAERRAAEEAARAAREAEEKAVALAEQGGDLDAITAALEQAEAQQARASIATVSSIAAQASKASVAGVTTRSQWKVAGVDLPALVKAAAERPELLAYLLPNETALRRLAQEAKADARVPGVVFVEDRIAAVR